MEVKVNFLDEQTGGGADYSGTPDLPTETRNGIAAAILAMPPAGESPTERMSAANYETTATPEQREIIEPFRGELDKVIEASQQGHSSLAAFRFVDLFKAAADYHGVGFKAAKKVTSSLIQYPQTVENMVHNAVDNILYDGQNQDAVYEDWSKQDNPLMQYVYGDIKDNKAFNEIVANLLLTTSISTQVAAPAFKALGASAWGKGKAASSLFMDNFLNGNSAKWQTLRSVYNSGKGGMNAYLSQAAGRIAGATAVDLAVDAATSPLWLFQKAEDDLQYTMDYGLLGKNILFNVGANTLLGGMSSYKAARKAIVGEEAEMAHLLQRLLKRESIDGLAQSFTDVAETGIGRARGNPFSIRDSAQIYATSRWLGDTSLIDFETREKLIRKSREVFRSKLGTALHNKTSLTDAALDNLAITTQYYALSRSKWLTKNKATRGVLALNSATGDILSEAETAALITAEATQGYIPIKKRPLYELDNTNLLEMRKESLFNLAKSGDITNGNLPSLTGNLSDDMARALSDIGQSGRAPSGNIANFLMPYDIANKGDPLASAVIREGKRVTREGAKVQARLLNKMGTIRRVMALPVEEQRPILEKFSDFYSAMANRGWDTGMLVERDGAVYVTLRKTQKNKEIWDSIIGSFDDIDLPEFVPSLRNADEPAALIAGSEAHQMFSEFQDVAKDDLVAKRVSSFFTGEAVQAQGVYTWVPSRDASEFYRVVDEITGNYATFGTRADAEKQLAIWRRENPHWVDRIHILSPGKESTKIATGIEGNITLRSGLPEGTRRGGKGGHWQGTLGLSPTKAGIQELVDGYMRKAMSSYHRAVVDSYTEVWDRLGMLGKDEKYIKTLQENLVGRVSPNPVMEQLDKAASFFNNVIKGDKAHIPSSIPADKLHLEKYVDDPIQRATIQKMFGKSANFLSRLYYSAGNLSAALVNLLSPLQSIPLAVQNFRQGSMETASEYLARTGFKPDDLKYRSGWSFANKFIKKLVRDDEWNALCDAEAFERGITRSEVKYINELQYGADKSSWFRKMSRPVEKTEEMSRGLQFKAGVAYAEELGYTGTDKFDFAEEFVDIGMGTFSPLGRTSVHQSDLGRQAMMFTTFVHNLLYRSLDMMADGKAREMVAANAAIAALTGSDALPFFNLWLGAHGLEDEKINDIFWDTGMAGMYGIYLGDRFGAGFSDLWRGAANPPAIKAVRDSFVLAYDIIRDISMREDVDGRAIMELVETEGIGPLMRRLAGVGLGYRVSIEGNVKSERMAWKDWQKKDYDEKVESLLQAARIAVGFKSTKEHDVELANRLERMRNAEDTRRKRAFTRIVKTTARGSGDIPEEAVKNALKTYRYDSDAMTSAILDAVDRGILTQEQAFNKDFLKKLDPVTARRIGLIQRSDKK